MSLSPCSSAPAAMRSRDRARASAGRDRGARRTRRQAGVLGGELEPEHRLEVALDHRLALHPQIGQVQRAAVERVEQQRRDRGPRPSASAIVSARALGDGQHPAVGDELQARARSRRRRPTSSSGRPRRRSAAARSRSSSRARTPGSRACPARRAAWFRAPARREGRRRARGRARRSARCPPRRSCSSAPRRSPPAASRSAASIDSVTASASASIVRSRSRPRQPRRASRNRRRRPAPAARPCQRSGSRPAPGARPASHVAGHREAHRAAGAEHRV